MRKGTFNKLLQLFQLNKYFEDSLMCTVYAALCISTIKCSSCFRPIRSILFITKTIIFFKTFPPQIPRIKSNNFIFSKTQNAINDLYLLSPLISLTYPMPLTYKVICIPVIRSFGSFVKCWCYICSFCLHRTMY